MQVYVELAIAENFCMDFTLLACAKFITKNRCSYRRIALGAAVGACFAVIFPLTGIGGAWAAVIKVAFSFALAAISGRFSSFKGYAAFAAAFLGIAALAGGALIALFALTGWEYSSGQGYIVSSVPIGMPLFFVLVLVLACRALSKKISARVKREFVRCVIWCGDKSIEQQGFFDSGNKVYFGGSPVSVISLAAACALVDVTDIKESVSINTVTGSKKIKVFTADKLVIYSGQNEHTIKCVKIGISPRAINSAVLHPDLAE